MDAIYGSIRDGWNEFLQPAFILWIIFMIPAAVGVFHLIDKKAKTLDRTLVAGVRFYHLIIANYICEGILTMVQLTLCIIVLTVGFRFKIVGSLVLCFILCFLVANIGMSLGMISKALSMFMQGLIKFNI